MSAAHISSGAAAGPALVLSAAQAAAWGEAELGGKAANLAWLSRNGFPTPDWAVLTTAAFDLHLATAGAEAALADLGALDPADEAGLDAAAAQLRRRIAETPLAPQLAAALATAVAALGEAGFFAVRSSAVGEDSAVASFAGQMDSFLFRRGLAAIEAAARECFASAFNDRAIRYRRRHGMALAATRAAVVVQRMIDGDVSGVAFTAHPITGRRDQALISAAYGAGEGIVSGLCAADEFTVPLYGDAVDKQLNEKDVALVFDRAAGAGLTQIAVDPAKRAVACLSDAQALRLRDLIREVAERKGAPQDIEWTLVGEDVHLLQTRPVTSLPLLAEGARVVWDNSNIQESYCGVTTPLTYSFARRAYAQVYEQTLRLTGPSAAMLEEYRPALENLLGLVRGRIYYNINNWYRGLMLLPSFRTNKADMERMMGLQDPVDFVDPPALGWGDKLRRLPRLARTLWTLLSAFRRIDALAAGFLADFNRLYAATDRRRFHQLALGDLIAATHRLRAEALNRWQPPILNDFYVMMMNGRVARTLEAAGLDNPALTQNKLMAGEEGIESTEPTKALIRLCGAVRRDPTLSQAFASVADARLLDYLQAVAPEFHARCVDYIERYGDRSMGELKLETLTLRQDPAFLFAMLRNLMSRADLDADGLEAVEKNLRREGEAEAFAAVRKKFGPWRLRRFRRAVQRLRAAVRNRENMRLARTRLFGLFRDLYREIGARLAFHGVLAAADDVFYLTVEEIEAYDEGRAVQTDLKALIAARRAEFAGYAAAEPAHHFITQGPVYFGNDFTYPYASAALDPNAESLNGLGCYPGVVEQELRLIFSPDDARDLQGRILCTVRTDPGWAPLFPSAGGILVERGSTLSHSAVVARELGVPAIVNIPGLTQILRDGERVRMDGATGTVLRLNPAPAPAPTPTPAQASEAP